MLFSELGLGEKLLEAIKNAGYTEATPIQEQAIPFVLQGRDVLGCAQTGTGKTASFVLPMIEKLASGRARARMPRSLILEPTRELAAQVQDNFEKYGAQHRLTTALIIGGESMAEQTKKLDRGVDVLIATPGRLIDQFERGNILMTDIRLLVIDECDRMLDMGFIPDIEKIVARLPKTRQTLLFSATVPNEIRRLADTFLSNPQEITVAAISSSAETVEQAMLTVASSQKRDALRHLLTSEAVRNAFIFCNRKRDIAALEKSLKQNGFNAGALHGDMVQSARQRTLEAFKQGEITLLVCSDVAARGIDVTGVSHVFNFDVPHHAEDYVHRIGRTGRAGNSGKAFMIATAEDQKSVDAIVKLIGKPIPEITISDMETSGDHESGAPSRSPRARSGRAAPAGARSARPRREEKPRAVETNDAQPDIDEPTVSNEAEPAKPESQYNDRPRGGRHAADRGQSDRRPREERPRDDRPRDDRQRNDRQRSDRGRPDYPQADRGRRDAPVAARPVSYGSVASDQERSAPRQHSSQQHSSPHQGQRSRRHDYDDDQHDSVVGFGDHLPAFLKVIPRMPKLEDQAASDE